MTFWDNFVQLRPKEDRDLFPFLRHIWMESEFILNTLPQMGMADAFKGLDPSGARLARRQAIDLFNQWMHDAKERYWFVLDWRFVNREDRWLPGDVFISAKQELIVRYRCHSVLAKLRVIPITIPAGLGEKPVVVAETGKITLDVVRINTRKKEDPFDIPTLAEDEDPDTENELIFKQLDLSVVSGFQVRDS